VTDDQEWTTLVLRWPVWLAEELRDESTAVGTSLSEHVAGYCRSGLPEFTETGR